MTKQFPSKEQLEDALKGVDLSRKDDTPNYLYEHIETLAASLKLTLKLLDELSEDIFSFKEDQLYIGDPAKNSLILEQMINQAIKEVCDE